MLCASASKDLLLRPLGCSCCCAGLQAAEASQNKDGEDVVCKRDGCNMHRFAYVGPGGLAEHVQQLKSVKVMAQL